MERKQKVMRHLDPGGVGLEIGPSHAPIAPKKDGYNVQVIDHLPQSGLIAKYQGHNVATENIEEVDYIWNGESYAELTGKTNHYDWIIASHVIEHTTDLIGFLNDCAAVLKDDGVLSLVIPDKRFCFDHFRPISGISRIIDSHHHRCKRHTVGTAAEYYLNVVKQSGQIAWSRDSHGPFEFMHSLDDTSRSIRRVADGEFLDLHAWCFVPHSFRLIIRDLHELGYITLQELDYLPTVGCEFYVSLSQRGRGPQESRFELLRKVEEETRIKPPGFSKRLAGRLKHVTHRILSRITRAAA